MKTTARNNISLEKIIIVCIFLFYSSINSFWGFRAFHDSDLFAAAACLIPITLIFIDLARKKASVGCGVLVMAAGIFAVVLISSSLGPKYVLYYGLCVSLLLLSDIGDYTSMLKLFYYFAILFAAGSMINLLLPGLYKAVILPAYAGSTQYERLVKWINRKQNFIIPGFANQTSFNACHFVYGLGYLFNKRFTDKKLRLREWLAAALFIVCLVLSNKRAHFLFGILALVVCYYFASNGRDKRKKLWRIVFGGAFLLLVLYIMVNTVDSGVFKKLAKMLNDLESGDDITSGRAHLYSLALENFLKKPVFGIGWEKFRLLPDLSSPISTHNIYLELLCETGVVGTAVFLFFFARSLVTAVGNCRRGGSRDYCLASGFCLFMQVIFLLYGLTGNPLYDPPYYVPYFLICAYTFSLARQGREPEEDPERLRA